MFECFDNGIRNGNVQNERLQDFVPLRKNGVENMLSLVRRDCITQMFIILLAELYSLITFNAYNECCSLHCNFIKVKLRSIPGCIFFDRSFCIYAN